MRQGMLTPSEAPSATSHLDIYNLSIFHYLGSPLGALIFDLMRNLCIYKACIYIYSIDVDASSLNASIARTGLMKRSVGQKRGLDFLRKRSDKSYKTSLTLKQTTTK